MADGVFAPSVPGLLFLRGQFAKNVSVMVGHNYREAPLFSNPSVLTDEELMAFSQLSYPGFPAGSLQYLVDNLYPAVYDGSRGYTSPLDRTIEIISDSSFVCNTNYINKAFGNKTYAYEFQVPPGLHGVDVASTFYDGTGTNLSLSVVAPIAEALQGYIVNFAMNGDPNGPGLPAFPMQGDNATMLAINATYIRPEPDDTANERCAWWQKALYS